VNEPLRLEPFDKRKHDRSQFDCGVAALNAYLRTSLGQHGRRDLTRGYVLATDSGTVAGSFTLAAGRLQVSVLPKPGRLPARMPLPTTLLARLEADRVDLVPAGGRLGVEEPPPPEPAHSETSLCKDDGGCSIVSVRFTLAEVDDLAHARAIGLSNCPPTALVALGASYRSRC